MLIIDNFENAANKFPNKTALIIDDCLEYSYSELSENIDNFSNILSSTQQHQSVVSLIFENSFEFIVSYMGVLKSGCIAHIIPHSISQINFEQQIKSANPKTIITSKKFLKYFNNINSLNIPLQEFTEFLSQKNKRNSVEIKPTDYAYLIYTSGTTSTPKGVPVTHQMSTFTTNNIVKILQYSKSDRDLLPLPLFHSFGLGCLHASLSVGSTLILHKNATNLDSLITSIEKNNATTLAAIPGTLTKLLSHSKLDVLSRLRLIITNSTKIPIPTVQSLKKILVKGCLSTYYGLSEASRSTFMIFNEDNLREDSVGKPATNVSIKIVNDVNDSSKPGEILIQGNNVIQKYWNNPTADNNIQDGWLKTGDLGFFDDEGYLFLTGRKDDVINIGGEKVMPEEIEQIVKQLDGINEVVAYGIQHNILGQVVKLNVIKNTESKLDKSDILSYCLKKLERHKVPTQIEFVNEIPKTPYGKVQRFMLTNNGE